MISYLHGDNNFLSRQKFNLLKEQFLEENPQGQIIVLNRNNFDPPELKASLANLSLWEEKQLYLIESLKSFPLPKQKKLLEILAKNKAEVIFWENQKTNLFKKITEHFPAAQEFIFSLPKVTYSFLEAVYPGNQKQFWPFWEQLKRQQPLELILYFLKKHCSQLLSAESKKAKIAGWQRERLLGQRGKFSFSKLKNFYLSLIELEFKQKRGQLAAPQEIPLVNLLLNL